MQQIFTYIGGVAQRILFDNMSSAVAQIEKDGQRKLTETFSRFTLHHGYKADFCNPVSGNEKGSVENKVGYLRRNFLLPPPVIEDWAAFNQALLATCTRDQQREHHAKKELIAELWALDQQGLLALPTESFRVFSLEKIKTDKYSFFQFENNQYSTTPEYSKCEMWLEVGTDSLRVLNGRYEEVANHVRRHQQEKTPTIDYASYLPSLIRKPRAFLNSPYFLTIPQVLQDYLQNCSYADLKKMLVEPLPIMQAGRLGDAAAVIELSSIRSADDFSAAFRALTEEPGGLPEVITP
jgi:hypothetical protein